MLKEDSVEVKDFDDLIGLVSRMASPIENPQMTIERWQAVIMFLEEMERRIFAQEASPDGEPWADLHPWTISKKGHSIKLVEESLLIDSMTNSAAQHAIRETELTGLFFGTNREFAASHQFGAGNIPQREFAGLSEDDLMAAVELVADAAVDMMFEVR
jgi:phage gpG-like protein